MAHKGSYRGTPKAARAAVSAKIGKLVGEGKPHKQAVATALSMARAGRLGSKGGYRRAK